MVVRGRPGPDEAFDVLASGGLPARVFHCSAGKDRTGVLSALILAFLGRARRDHRRGLRPERGGHGAPLERLKAEYPESVDGGRALRPGRPPRLPETMEQFLAAHRTALRQLRTPWPGPLGVVEAVDPAPPRRSPSAPSLHSAASPVHSSTGPSVGSAPCPASSTRRSST